MNSAAKRWMLRFVKLAVCAGALWYLSGKVTFRDYARLKDAPDLKQRILSEDNDQLVILDSQTGEDRPVFSDDLAVQDQLKPSQRPIERGLFFIIRTSIWPWTA